MATVARLRGLRDSVWLEQGKYEQAEGRYQEALARNKAGGRAGEERGSAVCDSIGATMSMIQLSLSANPQTGRRVDLEKRVTVLEKENEQLKKELVQVKGRVAVLEARLGVAPSQDAVEEDFDLFGEEDEGQEKQAIPELKPAKTKKPPVVAKSMIVLEVKPWDTETDMKEVEQLVRSIACEGLLWGASKLVDVAYGIKKLQVSCVVEDEKVSVDFLEESITGFEDHVQSVDIAAFNKL